MNFRFPNTRFPFLKKLWSVSGSVTCIGLIFCCCSLPAQAGTSQDAGADNDNATGISIFPSAVELFGSTSQQKLLVQRVQGGAILGAVTEDLVWKSQDPEIAVVNNGTVTPVGDGITELTVEVGEWRTSVSVQVRQANDDLEQDFERHVLPVISKAGCNQGACHGALAGKGGFRLSLRGYNPAGDYFTMTQEARGRRLELSEPGRSLVLAKPSGAIPHKGGIRLPVDSDGYRIIAEWIQSGAQPPRSDAPELTNLAVYPPHVQLKKDRSQAFVVVATYSDGRVEDVTPWAKFSSTDETIARVDSTGTVNVLGHGEGAVVVWFSSKLALARLVVPYDHPLNPLVFDALPAANTIDRLINQQLKELRLEPSPRCTDEVFLRRAYLDSTGTLPTPQQVETFLDDARDDKRARLVDQLLASENYVDYWSYKWSDLFLVNGRRLRPKAVKAYYRWIRDHVERNTAWDQVVREVLTATGSSIDNGATNFYALHQDPESMTENVCQAFLGLSIGCAKCHNHPLEKWTNDEYYAMANFFSRVKAKGWGGDGRSGDGVRTLFVVDRGDLIQPLTGRPQLPKPLDAPPLPEDATGDRRHYLADWLVSADNPYFARSVANRVWANFWGQGIVDPVDDMRISNPPRNEALLHALADHLVQSKFDLKSLMREILNSEAYQRSSSPRPSNRAEHHYYSRFYPRRLSAEVMLDAISQATGVPSEFAQIGYDGNDFQATSEYPRGTRAIELHDSAVVSRFLETFGRNERDITCECERSNTPSIVQVLHINNGTTINDRLRDEKSCVARAISDDLSWAEIIDQAYLRTLCRRPSVEQRRQLESELSTSNVERRVLIEDLYWSLMSTREFLFNH